MNEAVRQEIESLRRLKTKELKLRYRSMFGEDSPSSNHQHLFRRIAWRLQAQAEGGLSEAAKQRAAQLGEDLDLRLRAPRAFWDELIRARSASESRRDLRLPPVGTILERSYRGKTIVVTVLELGFTYDGQTFGSLSAIAHLVTGTRWNGFLFFGLLKSNGE
jgi:hypothetical protein